MNHKNTKDSNKIFALYDEEDRPLGCYDREELRQLLNTTRNNFNCLMCKIRTGSRSYLYYRKKLYKVYIYEEN